jgi:cytochrome c peroxidase
MRAPQTEEGRMARLRWMAASVVAVLAAAAAAAAADDATLLKEAREIFKPLPKDMGTPGLPLTTPRVELGRMLFFDPRFTIDANMSCSTCHQPALYGTDGLAKSIGVQQRPHPRNAPTILNSALSITHWRGDRESVEDQVIKAMTSPITFGQPDEKAVLDRLARIPGYAPLFKAAFPDDADPMTAQNTAKAIGAYERTLVTPSPFDAYLAGNVNALSPMARVGLEKFISTGCVACHEGVGVGGAMYRKFGVLEDYWKATGSQIIDKGRVEFTKNADDLYVFRVPSLRNVAMTAPYFHDGSVAALPDAVRIMARVQLGVTLTDADTRDIVAFLGSLTGELPASFGTVPALPPGSVIPGK